MNWLLTIVLCGLLVELTVRLPLLTPLVAIRRSGTRAVHVLTVKNVSDHWKEKAMAAYARSTFTATAKVAGLLSVVLGVAFASVLVLDRLSNGFETFILSWGGIGSTVVIATLYFAVRKPVYRG